MNTSLSLSRILKRPQSSVFSGIACLSEQLITPELCASAQPPPNTRRSGGSSGGISRQEGPRCPDRRRAVVVTAVAFRRLACFRLPRRSYAISLFEKMFTNHC